MSKAEDVKVVPQRNDLKKQPLFVKADIADQAGKRPGYRRQWVHATDRKHPQYYEKYLKRQPVGNPEVGYCWAEPWTVVQATGNDGRARDDQGKNLDTALMHGELVCVETTDENAAVYTEFERLCDEAQTKRLKNGDDERENHGNGGYSRYQARVSTGFNGTPHELLDKGA